MFSTVLSVIFGLAALVVGYFYLQEKNSKGGLSESVLKKRVEEKVKEVREEKQAQLDEYKKELLERLKEKEDVLREKLEAKNLIDLEKMKLKTQENLKKEEDKMREKMLDLQMSLDKKEGELNEKLEEVNRTKEELNKEKSELIDEVEKFEEEKKKFNDEAKKELSKISKLPPKKAQEQLLERTKEEMGEDLLEWQKKTLDRYKDEVDYKAREMVSLAMQRCSSEVANEVTVTNIKLKSDEEKGKIIGKQGRNIQWLEKTLGVEIIVDETPEVITISGFNSIRRHVAKRTLEMLLDDGRVHPASIEDMHNKAKAELSRDVMEAGRWAVEELGIFDFSDKLVRMVGRLKFRTSYGQNMLTHSVEMAKLAKILTEDLNERFPHREPIDIDIAVKGALLHDIGKALDEETQPKGNHITLGEKVCETFNLDWRIKKCVSSHHDESYEDEEKGVCVEAIVVDICDNISGGRPGARKESMEAYMQRMEAMEKIAQDTPGVNKSWIMRGSRELWVFFDTDKITPAKMHDLTKEIAERIQTDVTYPGEIKVIGLWEDKIVEYAH